MNLIQNKAFPLECRVDLVNWGVPSNRGFDIGGMGSQQIHSPTRPDVRVPRPTHQDMSEVVGVRYTTMFGDPGREFLQSGSVFHWSPQESKSAKFVLAEGRENIDS